MIFKVNQGHCGLQWPWVIHWTVIGYSDQNHDVVSCARFKRRPLTSRSTVYGIWGYSDRLRMRVSLLQCSLRNRGTLTQPSGNSILEYVDNTQLLKLQKNQLSYWFRYTHTTYTHKWIYPVCVYGNQSFRPNVNSPDQCFIQALFGGENSPQESKIPPPRKIPIGY